MVNSVHLQSTHTPHSQRFQSDPHLESGRRPVVEFFAVTVNVLRPLAVFTEELHH